MARVFLCDKCGKIVDNLVVAQLRATGIADSENAPSGAYDNRIELCSECWSTVLTAFRPIEHKHEVGRSNHRWTTSEDAYIVWCIAEQINYNVKDMARIMGVTPSALSKRLWQIKQLKKNDKAKFDMLLRKAKKSDYITEHVIKERNDTLER